MSLIEIWNTSPAQLRGKQAKQVIAFAGKGSLTDGSTSSAEFREFLNLVPSKTLFSYADECITTKFDNSGLALQDVVNELGRRLGFAVEDGLYGTNKAAIAWDGLWRSSTDHAIVVEVKSSVNFRIDLEIVAEYRKGLMKAGRITSESSSILIVVGAEETSELEAQIRGSRHAWDVRVISVSGLKRLVQLKEDLDDPVTVRRIGEILIPYEYTRVDRIIDLVFSTTEEVLQEEATESPPPPAASSLSTDAALGEPMNFNALCAARVGVQLHRPLIKRSRTLFASPDQSTAVVCLVSKEHATTAGRYYWYGYHDYHREALGSYQDGFVAFGCGSPDEIVLIPRSDLENWLSGMNSTATDRDFYRHIQIFRENGELVLHRKKGERRIVVTKYLLPKGGS